MWPMTTNLDREIAFDERILSIKSHNSLITWTHQVTRQVKKHYISISMRTVATRLHRMVAYDKEPQTTKSEVFLITW